MKKVLRAALVVSSVLSLTACASTVDRLSEVGGPPKMQRLDNPNAMHENYQPISWPTPVSETQPTQHANSLWQQGSRTFFRDQRASRVGDILKVVMDFKDRTRVESRTNRSRTGSEEVGIGAVFGLEKIIPGQGGPNGALQFEGESSTTGDGRIERREEISTQFAATVVQVLPNGNFVIDGRQEIRVDNEIREISVQGVVRPEDINSANTIDYSQIAEARISYGGRGHLSEYQRPRWGHEVIEVLSPF